MTQQDKPVNQDEFDKNFDEWWDSDYDDSSNPYRIGTPIYWAWAGWIAKAKLKEKNV